MASIFEDAEVLDLPFVPIEITVRGKQIPAQARALSAEEEDNLDAIQMDDYGKHLTEMSQGTGKGLSELERVRAIYKSKSIAEIVDQLLETRDPDIRRRALELTGINFTLESTKMASMEEAEREVYAKARNDEYDEAIKTATLELRTEMESGELEQLVDQISQVNINLKALTLARKSYNALFVHASVYKLDATKAFDSVSQLRAQAKSETIAAMVQVVQEALKTDLPFDALAATEPSGQPPSPNTSEEATPDGGTPTETTPAS